MKIKTQNVLAFTSILVTTAASADGINWGQHNFDIGTRARYTTVDIPDDNGKASSLLIRARIETQWHESISSEIEYDYVGTGFKNDHRDGLRFNDKPLVPDSPGDEINQAYVKWKTNPFIFTINSRIYIFQI